MIDKILNWLYTAKPEHKNRTIEDVTPEDIKLWKKLMLEEIEETIEDLIEKDSQGLLDDVIDCIWTSCNIAAMAGVKYDDLIKYAYKVQESNDSKFCDNEQDAIDSVFRYATGTHPDKPNVSIETYFEKVGDKYVIFRTEDNKIMKNYKYYKLA